MTRSTCRKRALPPSVRFLGRKVYAAVAIVEACIAEAAHRHWQEACRVARVVAGGSRRALDSSSSAAV